MGRLISRFKAFWLAEEIPRWFGLSLVAVFLLGLGTLTWVSQKRTREFAMLHTARSNRDAILLLADLLMPHASDNPQRDQSMLRRFAVAHHCSALRVYGADLKIIASLNARDIGQPLPEQGERSEATPEKTVAYLLDDDGGQRTAMLLRAPITTANGEADSGRFVEGVFEFDAPPALLDPLHAGSLFITLASTTAFLLVYRKLRQHFRSMSRIADSLTSTEDLDEQLEELRLSDTQDAVAVAWNRLVDLNLTLKEEVSRSTASSELLAALSGQRGGELAEAMFTVPLGVILLTGQGDVAYANVMSCRLCGWDPGGDTKYSFSDGQLTDEGRKILEVLQPCLEESGPTRTVDRQIEGTDGGYYHLQIVPVQSEQHIRRHVILILDVSQQVRADVAREDFVSQVTHELRTPLTNIRAYAETLSSGMFDDPKVITECYNVITKETRRLSRLIEDILSISQLEVGTMQLVYDKVDLRDLLSDGVRDVRGIAEAKSIDLQIQLPAKLDPIMLDRDKMAVVINNLLGNALKYTREGGQVTLSCHAKDDKVRFSTKDSGLGIDQKDHERIFEKFQRAEDPEVQNEAGTGIGLTTAREIVRQHGGDILLISRKGEGSTFTVELPMTSSAPLLAAT